MKTNRKKMQRTKIKTIAKSLLSKILTMMTVLRVIQKSRMEISIWRLGKLNKMPRGQRSCYPRKSSPLLKRRKQMKKKAM